MAQECVIQGATVRLRITRSEGAHPDVGVSRWEVGSLNWDQSVDLSLVIEPNIGDILSLQGRLIPDDFTGTSDRNHWQPLDLAELFRMAQHGAAVHGRQLDHLDQLMRENLELRRELAMLRGQVPGGYTVMPTEPVSDKPRRILTNVKP